MRGDATELEELRPSDVFLRSWKLSLKPELESEKDVLAVEEARQQGPEGEVQQGPIEPRPGGIMPYSLAQDVPMLAEKEVLYPGAEMGVVGHRADIQGAESNGPNLGDKYFQIPERLGL